MKKALIYSSVASMIDQFNRDNIQILKKLGYQVEVACNFEKGNTINKEQINQLKQDLKEADVQWHHLPVPRSLGTPKDIFTSYSLSKQMINKNGYDLIHFHSPIGAAIGRMAAKKAQKKGTKIIYTAHGFHFFKGAPLANWLLYYPLERFLSRFTDILITINKEDFERAESFKSKKVDYVPGVGIDTRQIELLDIDREAKRQELGIQRNELFLLSIGELNKNKNHQMMLTALSNINQPFRYIICGKGDELANLKKLSHELGIEENVQFLGYRQDIKEILKVADLFCFPSKREGLSVALMEAMAAGLPCLVSDIRGNRDLINENGGLLFNLKNEMQLKEALKQLMSSEQNRQKMGQYNSQRVKDFDKKIVNKKMQKIYT